MKKSRTAFTVLHVLLLAFCLCCIPTKAIAAAKDKSGDAKAAIEACVGKSAAEALEVATEAGYDATFKDAFYVNVTEAVKDASSDSGASAATVQAVDASDGWLFFKPSVTFTLDYVDPEAQQAREEKERREQEEQLRKQNRKAIEQSEGEAVSKVLTLADDAGFNLTIRDDYGTDVTKSVRKAKSKSRIRKAKVNYVTIDRDYENDTYNVEVYIDYLHPKSLEKIAQENGWPTDMTITNASVLVEDSDPTSRRPKYYITVTGTITNNGKWAVERYHLPALGCSDYSFQKCAEMQLEGYAKELGVGETRDFELFFYTMDAGSTVVLQTENSAAVIEGAQEISDEIGRQLQSVKEAHDANVDYLSEMARENETCYYTEYGSCYHSRPGCPALSNSSSVYETTVGEAEYWGLERCDRCY